MAVYLASVRQDTELVTLKSRCFINSKLDTIQTQLIPEIELFSTRCTETKQIDEYLKITDKLYSANSNQIYKMTGCLSKCDKFSYTIRETTGLSQPTWNVNNNSFTIWLYISTGETEVREQVNE